MAILTDMRNTAHALARDNAYHSDVPSAKLPEFKVDEAYIGEGLANAQKDLASSTPITTPFERVEKKIEYLNDKDEKVFITQALEFRTQPDGATPPGVTVIAGSAQINVPLNPALLTELVVEKIKERFNMSIPGQPLSADIEATLNALKNFTEGGVSALKNLGAKNIEHNGFNAVGADLSPENPEQSKIEQSTITNWCCADANMAGRIFDECIVDGLDARRANMRSVKFTAAAEGNSLNVIAIDADWTGGHISDKIKIDNLDARGTTMVDFTFGDKKLVDFILEKEPKDIKAKLNNLVYDDDTIFSTDADVQKAIIAKLDQCSVEVELNVDRKYTGKLVIENFSGSSLYNTLNSADDKIMTVFWRDGTSSRLQLSEDGKKVAITEIQKDGSEKVLSSNFSGEQAADYLTKRLHGIKVDTVPAPEKTPPTGPDGEKPKGGGRKIVDEGAKTAEDAERKDLLAKAEALRKAAAEEHDRIKAQEAAVERERILEAATNAAVANGVDKPVGLTTGLVGDAANMAAAVVASGAEPTPTEETAKGPPAEPAPDSEIKRESKARRVQANAV